MLDITIFVPLSENIIMMSLYLKAISDTLQQGRLQMRQTVLYAQCEEDLFHGESVSLYYSLCFSPLSLSLNIFCII